VGESPLCILGRFLRGYSGRKSLAGVWDIRFREMVELDKIRALAERVAKSHGLEVVDLEFRGGAGKQRMLRVFIEKGAEARDRMKEGASDGIVQRFSSAYLAGVTHDDCSNFSGEFGTLLDVEELIPGSAYTLEVSSPGLDRKLTSAADYERFTGSLIKVATRDPIRGNRFWQGRLESFTGGTLILRPPEAKRKRQNGPRTRDPEGEIQETVAIDLANVERANLVPEI
jgi:ribosome maturation factor RimP